MIPVAEALSRILATLKPLPAETVALPDGHGRVLAEAVVARVTQPPYAMSAIDGWAIRAAETRRLPIRLRRIGDAPAGKSFRGMVGPGETVRIYAGAPLPGGTDGVVGHEAVRAEGDFVWVEAAVGPGENVRQPGVDFKTGQIGVAAGRLLSGRDLGLAAAMNVPWLRVRRRPRVAILSTGNELVLPGEPLGPNQVFDANGVALAGLIEAAGGVPVNLGIARDTPESLVACAGAAEGADLLVISGGASGGDYDLVRQVLGERGLAIEFWKLAMRPGGAVMFGRAGALPVLGLPGNPVSCLVSALLFLRPAVQVLLGRSPVDDRGAEATPSARLSAPVAANDERQSYLRATLSREHASGNLIATPFPHQDSSMLSRLAWADCLILREPLAPAAEVGDRVEIIPLLE